MFFNTMKIENISQKNRIKQEIEAIQQELIQLPQPIYQSTLIESI